MLNSVLLEGIIIDLDFFNNNHSICRFEIASTETIEKDNKPTIKRIHNFLIKIAGNEKIKKYSHLLCKDKHIQIVGKLQQGNGITFVLAMHLQKPGERIVI